MFGEIVDCAMQSNELGQIVQACWEDLPRHYPHVELDAFTMMPNHVHGIIVIHDDQTPSTVGAGLKPALTQTINHSPTSANPEHERAGLKPAPTGTKKQHGLPEIIRAFKTFSSRRINDLRNTPGTSLWQRNYYEHVIRNHESLDEIRQYIADNSLRWELDEENPINIRKVISCP